MAMEFIDTHDKCLKSWDLAIQSGEIGELELFPSREYQGIFGYLGANDVPSTGREEAIAGLKQLVQAVKGSIHEAKERRICYRSEDEAVVTYDRIIRREEKIVMTFFVLQTWRLLDNEWKIVRESSEHIG